MGKVLKEQMILRAVCDERISVPMESLQQFPEVYKALMDRIGGPGALAEVKVNWRCNTKQWWVGAVPDSVAPSIYRKLGYTNDMIKLMGLDPSAPGCRTGADGPDIRPRGGEGDEGIVYPPITSHNVHGLPEEELSGGDEACLLGAHGVWLGPELRHPMEAHPEDQRDPGGLHVQVLQGVLAHRGEGAPAFCRSGPARPSFSWCWTSRRMACTTVGSRNGWSTTVG